jgi:hypothetical protein
MSTKTIETLDRNFAVTAVADGLNWYDIRLLGLEGQGWRDTAHPFDRLPARAQGIVRDPVWQLSHHSAGMAVRFVTDATELHARWTLRSSSLAMDHMPATGMSGLDLYMRDDDRWRWAGVGRPGKADSAEQAAPLTSGLRAGEKTFLLYLPLYNGIEQVWIGVPEGRALRPAAPRPPSHARPLCFYGTSIVHGGCASRPGMAYPALLGRWLDRPVINLGFSGSAPMDLEMAPLLGELDPAAYILDPLPNMSADQVTERAERFVTLLRAARPTTPIVLVENIIYQRSAVLEPSQRGHVAKNVALRAAFGRLQQAGVANLWLVPEDKLLGDDGEATVDGTHPTDVGFLRLAEALAPVIRDCL